MLTRTTAGALFPLFSHNKLLTDENNSKRITRLGIVWQNDIIKLCIIFYLIKNELMRITHLLWLLFLCFFRLNVQAQVYHPFPKDSALWSYYIDDLWGELGTRPVAFMLKGDTAISGIAYKKIHRVYGFSFSYDSASYIHAFLREENKRIYMRYPYHIFKDTAEHLLCDFNVKLNDTVMVDMLRADSNGFYRDSLVVNKIDSFLTKSGYRKSVWVNFLTSNKSGSSTLTNFRWIEGIGGYFHPFYIEVPESVAARFIHILECFENETGLLLGQKSQCYVVMHTPATPQIVLSPVFPNPARVNEDVYIHSKEEVQLEVISLQAKTDKSNYTIKQGLYTGEYEVRFHTPGMYVVRITSLKTQKSKWTKILIL